MRAFQRVVNPTCMPNKPGNPSLNILELTLREWQALGRSLPFYGVEACRKDK